MNLLRMLATFNRMPCTAFVSGSYFKEMRSFPFFGAYNQSQQENRLMLLLHVRPNYIYSTSNDIHTDGARPKTGGHKGIREDRRFKRRGGYPMETSYHFIQ